MKPVRPWPPRREGVPQGQATRWGLPTAAERESADLLPIEADPADAQAHAATRPAPAPTLKTARRGADGMRAMKVRIPIAVLAAVAVIAAILIFSSGGRTGGALDPVAQAAETTMHARGAHMSLTGTVTVSNVAIPITFSGHGLVQLQCARRRPHVDDGRLPRKRELEAARRLLADDRALQVGIHLHRLTAVRRQAPGRSALAATEHRTLPAGRRARPWLPHQRRHEPRPVPAIPEGRWRQLHGRRTRSRPRRRHDPLRGQDRPAEGR